MKRIFVIGLMIILTGLFPTNAFAQTTRIKLVSHGSTSTFRFQALALQTNGVMTSAYGFIQDKQTGVRVGGQMDALNAFDVNADAIPDVFFLTMYDPELAHPYANFTRIQIVVVAPGFSETAPDGLVHYLLYEGGILRETRNEPLENGVIRVSAM